MQSKLLVYKEWKKNIKNTYFNENGTSVEKQWLETCNGLNFTKSRLAAKKNFLQNKRLVYHKEWIESWV